jgi:4a-hydroxytetrahydrobiopterin dehydratase
VTDQEVKELQPQVPQWCLITEDGIKKLDRLFRFDDFRQALKFTQLLGEDADEEGHHPRLIVEWGRVQVTWWTHKIRNIHRNDFIMAAKSDRFFEELIVGK